MNQGSYRTTLTPTVPAQRRTIKRQQLESGVRRDDAWVGYELRWTRPRYEIAPKPDVGTLAVVWKHRALALGRYAVPERGGVIPENWPRRTGVPWPEGGVFLAEGWPQEDGPAYNPVEVADRILLDVQRTPTDSPKELLRFVNRWGALGVGIPGAEHFSLDGVALTARALGQLQRWIEAFHALKRGRETKATWDGLSFWLDGALAKRVYPATKPMDNGLEPVFRVGRLIDALWFELWDRATEGARLRRCPECRALFVPGRANQTYCTRQCANRPTVRRWKRAQRRLRRLRERESRPADRGTNDE